MNYLALSLVLRKNRMYLFTLGDIKNLFPDENEKTKKQLQITNFPPSFTSQT